MTEAELDDVKALLTSQRIADAQALVRGILDKDPSDWNACYWVGQCCRFLGDISGAIEYLSRAAAIRVDDPPILLALGIALQLDEQWDKAIATLVRAIDVDPDYELAYNSLGFTQVKCGELETALHNYDAGAIALTRRIVRAMVNSRSSKILKHRDTIGTRWTSYAMQGALWLCTQSSEVHSVGWPSGQMAIEEETTDRNAGLYWLDSTRESGETFRLFLPNYFNTFRETLKADPSYSHLIRNRGMVLQRLGQSPEAEQHLNEADEFTPIPGTRA